MIDRRSGNVLNVLGSVAQSVEHRTCNQAALGSTPASSQKVKVADNILGQDMNLMIVSPHQGAIGTSR